MCACACVRVCLCVFVHICACVRACVCVACLVYKSACFLKRSDFSAFLPERGSTGSRDVLIREVLNKRWDRVSFALARQAAAQLSRIADTYNPSENNDSAHPSLIMPAVSVDAKHPLLT